MIEKLKQVFNENGIEFKEITSELIAVENFLTEEDLNFIWGTINNATQEDWEKEYVANLKRFCLQKFGRDDVDNLVAEGKFEVTRNWEDKNLSITGSDYHRVLQERMQKLVQMLDLNLMLKGLATIQRMQPGVSLTSHTDQVTDPSVVYASIAYINDDYNGGELFFENLNLKIKPKAGTLLFFPGNEEYKHGVEAVLDGPIRYVLVGFITEKGFYEKNRY
jgi:hypothetical protein